MQKAGVPAGDDLLNDLPALLRRLCGDERADGEAAQRITDRERALGGILAAREGQRIRPALALRVDVDPRDLIGEGIDEPGDLLRIAPEDADLLPVVRCGDELQEVAFIAIRAHGND